MSPSRSRPIAAAVLALLLCVMASAAGDTATAPPATTPQVEAIFERGETLEFTMTWMALTGGTSVMKIGPVEGKKGTYRIESLSESSPSFAKIYKVRDYIESVVERDTFSTIHFRKILREKNRHKDVTTEFDYEKGVATRRGKEIPIRKPLLDPLSTVYYVRRLELVPGRVYHATILADSRIHQPEIRVVRRERVTTAAGTFNTVMVEPKLKEGSLHREGDSRLFIWYTDDARRIPVRIRTELSFGSITASLRSVQPGATWLPAEP